MRWFRTLLLAVALLVPTVAHAKAAPGPRPRPVQGTGLGIANGTSPQAKLMARRAAEVRAVADLRSKLELPGGHRVPPFRYVSSGLTGHGRVRVVVESHAVRVPR